MVVVVYFCHLAQQHQSPKEDNLKYYQNQILMLVQQKFSKEEQDEIAQMLKKEKSKGQGKD